MASVAAPAAGRSARLWMVAILLLAFLAFSGALTAESLWLDEATSLFIAQQPPIAVVREAAADTHPPLYYLVLHLTSRLLFGENLPAGHAGEFATRWPSVCAGLLSVAALYALGRRLARPGEAGLLAALFLALSAYERWYAQEGRMYALLTLWGLLATYLWLRALQTGERRWWLLYVPVAAAGLYTHYYFLLVLLFHNGYVVATQIFPALTGQARLRAGLRTWVIVQILTGLVFLPWLPTLLSQVGRGEGLWVSLAVGRPDASTLLFSAVRFSGMPLGGPLLLRAAAYLLAGGLGVWGLARWRNPAERRVVSLAAFYFALPLAAALLVSQWRPIFADRYVLLALPGWCLLVGAGVRGLPGLRRRQAVVALFAGLMVLTVVVQAVTPENPPWRDVAAWVSARAQPGDFAVFIPSFHWRPFVYYGDHVVAYQDELWLPNDDLDWKAQFAEAARGHGRIWLIWRREHWGDPTGRVRQMLAAQATLVTQREFSGIDVVMLFDLEGHELRANP